MEGEEGFLKVHLAVDVKDKEAVSMTVTEEDVSDESQAKDVPSPDTVLRRAEGLDLGHAVDALNEANAELIRGRAYSSAG